jgi:hypothetical protein
MYNLEFKLPRVLEHLGLPINPEALDICSSREALPKTVTRHEADASSKIRQALLQPQKKRVKWTPEEENTVLQMKDGGKV